jgi:hypothetical protein
LIQLTSRPMALTIDRLYLYHCHTFDRITFKHIGFVQIGIASQVQILAELGRE